MAAILSVHDLVKKYGDVAGAVIKAMRQYCDEIRQCKFPTDEHVYRMIEGEEQKFMELME